MPRARRRLLAACFAMSAALSAVVPAAASTNDPILLVHGWRGSPTTWGDMIARFAAVGRTAVAIDLATEDNVKNAAQIRDFIRARGWTKVDIVGQSMGGLSARHYIKFLGPTVVDTYVSLGTPQYGMYSACLLFQSAGGQMCPSSSFLRNLNGGDDTPAGAGSTAVYWTTIYSTSDGVVPNSSSRLDGGACHVQVSGVGHNDMDNSAGVFEHVLASVNRATCTGTFK
jgi:triacylglycerol lipase